MATNFPGSVDNFSNPAATDSLNSPSHSSQHADANDAIEAIETYVLANPTGLVHINTTSVSAASIISLDNVFTTTYKFYRLIYALTGSTGTNINIKFRASGSDLSAASYARQRISASSTTVSGARATGGTSGLIGNVGANKCGGIIEFFDPFATADKVYRSVMADRNNGGEFEDVVGVYAPTPSVTADGVSIIPASGNLTGFLSVYGFRN
jgi:hypothetical protein